MPDQPAPSVEKISSCFDDALLAAQQNLHRCTFYQGKPDQYLHNVFQPILLRKKLVLVRSLRQRHMPGSGYAPSRWP